MRKLGWKDAAALLVLVAWCAAGYALRHRLGVFGTLYWEDITDNIGNNHHKLAPLFMMGRTYGTGIMWASAAMLVVVVLALIAPRRHREKEWVTDYQTGERHRIEQREAGRVIFTPGKTHTVRFIGWAQSMRDGRKVLFVCSAWWAAIVAVYFVTLPDWTTHAPTQGWATAKVLVWYLAEFCWMFTPAFCFMALSGAWEWAVMLRGRNDLGEPAPVVQPKGPYGDTAPQHSGEHLR